MLSKKIVNVTFVIMAVVLIATTTSASSHKSLPSTASFKYMQITHTNVADLVPSKLHLSSSASSATATSNKSSSTAASSSTSSRRIDSSSCATKSSKAAPNVSAAFFPLTSTERDKVERVVMASCGELDVSLMAKANAQVILDRVKSGKFGKSVNAVLDAPHQFETPWKGSVNTMVKTAVSAVFDRGERVTSARIYYYENPNLAETSPTVWRQGKQYIMTIGHGTFIHQYWTDTN